MAFERINRESWETFLDRLSRLVMGSEAEVEVVGLDIGDQIETDWVGLRGLSFDEHDGDIVVHLEQLDHRIVAPRELHVDRRGLEVPLVVVIDEDGREHFIRLRRPVELPGDVSEVRP